MSEWCWLNGDMVPAQSASVSVFDHGLLYGDGVFEGIRFYRRKAFRLAAHLQRLQDSARAIGLQMPYNAEQLAEAVAAVIEGFEGVDGYLRLVVTRGRGALGIDPGTCRKPTVFILAAPLAVVPGAVRLAGARLITASTRRLPLDGLDPRVKSLNYLNHVLARMEASRAGADEALLLNAAGRLAEASVENVFLVRDGVLLTPPCIDGALDGITRGCVIELALKQGVAARETSLAPYDVYTADEVFLTGTGAELIPVREVDGRDIPGCPGPVFQQLERTFRQLVAEECGFNGAQSQ